MKRRKSSRPSHHEGASLLLFPLVTSLQRTGEGQPAAHATAAGGDVHFVGRGRQVGADSGRGGGPDDAVRRTERRCPFLAAKRKTYARLEVFGFWPISDVGIAGHRPTILLYNHSISPSPGVDLEQRARRAATGGYSGGGCRGLLPLNRDRRRRHAGATESAQKRRFSIPKSLSITDVSSRIPGTALLPSSPAWSTPSDVPTKFNAAWPNKISTCRRTSGSNSASAFTSVILLSKKTISLVTGSILQCVSKGLQSRAVSASRTTLVGKFVAR